MELEKDFADFTPEQDTAEWDEEVEKDIKFYFGDEVMIPNGDIGKVTEIDRNSDCKYRVDSSVALGWFRPEELTKVL